MKKLITALMLFAFLSKTNGQDIIDPYKLNYTTTPNLFNGKKHPFLVYSGGNPVAPVYDTDDDYRQNNGSYIGEYMISLRNLHWSYDWSNYYSEPCITCPPCCGIPGCVCPPTFHSSSPWESLAKTYKMEVVSFPFTCNCYNSAYGCAHDDFNPNNPNSNTERILSIPATAYDPLIKSWDLIQNIRDNGVFTPITGPGPGGPMSGGDGYAETLISISFRSNLPVLTAPDRKYLPHTAIKHSVYIHCSSNPASDIMDSIVWVYDNTRGRMRNYPFIDQNQGGGAHAWDVIFLPELIDIPYNLYPNQGSGLYTNYTNQSNSNWFDGGTIDYMGFHDGTLAVCNANSYFPMAPIDDFSFSDFNTNVGRTTYNFWHASPSPYSLYTTYLRNTYGSCLVGYDINNGDLSIPNGRDGIKHEYFIDRGYPFFDLTVINAGDKIIYNPSEVTVVEDASPSGGVCNVIFPSGYTFKTILGRYPSWQEVTDANTAANGGPYTDLKQVPVPVNAADLPQTPGTTAIDYPPVMWDDPDPSTSNIDERYGYYYIDNLGQITVEPCVRIFDAKFEVRPGGTLIFEDYYTVINPTRFTVTGTGGVIAKNCTGNQYLQNTVVTQPQHIRYTAFNTILAGTNVDPITTVTDAPYTVASGGDIEFKAENYISLKDGFSAKLGSTFKAHCGIILVPTNCPAWSSAGGSGQRSLAQQKQENAFTKQGLLIAPNPANENVSITCSAVSSGSIYIRDITGRIIIQQPFNMQTQLNTSSLTQGIYVAEVKDDSGNSVKGKMVKE